MAQSVSQVVAAEDLVWISGTDFKLSVVVHNCNLSTRGWETGRSLEFTG